MEPHKHVEIEWIQWGELWAMILADMEADQQEKHFFPSMKNMVVKYSKRNDPSCLDKRLA